MNLFLDFETWSSVPIKRGTDVYLDNAKAIIFTYAFDNGPVQATDLTEQPFPDIRLGLNDVLIAHNAFFDRMVLQKCIGTPTGVDHWQCTMAQASAHGLPGGLGPLCEVLGVPTDKSKDADGMRLIRKFCGPKQIVKDADWQKFIEYAKMDVVAMRECYKRMPQWNYPQNVDELALWRLDQTINNRGFAVDLKLAEAAVVALKKQKTTNDDWTNQATGGAVTAATQRDKMLMYLCEQQGCFLPDLKAATITQALEDESLEETTKDLLRVRLSSSKTSGAKFKRMMESVGKDGRLRGTLQFAGANRTARWAGRIFQPHNLPRPTMEQGDIRNCTELIRTGRADLVPLFADVNEACSNALRGLIVAEEGKMLLIADYSAIEGRVNAWQAGEDWKVKAFREGQDLYKLIYSRGFGIDISCVTKAQRQIGKVEELALGYGGGVGAFLNMAAAYGMDLDELGRTVVPVDNARKAWERALKEGETFGLTEESYLACETLKLSYRKANPAIVASWYMYEDAARKVILAKSPSLKIQVGNLVFDCNDKWMRIKLPSGRYLSYALPHVGITQRIKRVPGRANDGTIKYEIGEERSSTISYMSWRNRKWSRTKTYGGKLCENIVQAIARDLLGCALVELENVGFPVVLHVHDEALAEVIQSSGKTLKDFIRIMASKPKWASGLPLNAEGFEGTRYEKH